MVLLIQRDLLVYCERKMYYCSMNDLIMVPAYSQSYWEEASHIFLVFYQDSGVLAKEKSKNEVHRRSDLIDSSAQVKQSKWPEMAFTKNMKRFLFIFVDIQEIFRLFNPHSDGY